MTDIFMSSITSGKNGLFSAREARKPLAALDFEATRLPGRGSYPIEAAIVHEDGREWSRLILPHPLWADLIWDTESEKIHGISRELLMSAGVPADVAARELRQETENCILSADHEESDAEWLRILNATAGLRTPALCGQNEFYFEWISRNYPDDYEPGINILDGLRAEGFERYPERHRALPDARRWMHYMKAVLRQPVPGLTESAVPGT